jgi:hypothetical protein
MLGNIVGAFELLQEGSGQEVALRIQNTVASPFSFYGGDGGFGVW